MNYMYFILRQVAVSPTKEVMKHLGGYIASRKDENKRMSHFNDLCVYVGRDKAAEMIDIVRKRYFAIKAAEEVKSDIPEGEWVQMELSEAPRNITSEQKREEIHEFIRRMHGKEEKA